MNMSQPWTASLVGERLVAAYRRVSSQPVLSDRGGFTVAGQPLHDDILAPFAWPDSFVADAMDRRILRTWASCRATSASVRERYRGFGWTRSAAERRRREALEAIAKNLNRGLTKGPVDGEQFT